MTWHPAPGWRGRLGRRRRARAPRPVRVVYLVHLIESWDSCADVVLEMQRAEDFEPIVVSIPRRFNGDASFGFEEEVHRGLEAQGVPHRRVPVEAMANGRRVIEDLEPDLLFRQSQWDDDIPEVFATDQLQFVRTVLIPYETMNIVQNVAGPGTSNTAVDSPFHRAAWIVFCANDLVLEQARRDGETRGAQFRVAGHPKADRLRHAESAWPIDRPDGDVPRARVTWSAHHSIADNWTMFGTFPSTAPDMLGWARARPDWDFVFLPHPALVPFCNRPESPMSRPAFDAWHREWCALANTATHTGGRYAPVLAASDLLVTDGLSLLVEYQLLARPLVFLERAGHRPFNEIGELVRQGAHAVATVPEARTVAEQIHREGIDPLEAQQRVTTERLFGDRPSAPRILSILRDRINAEGAHDTNRDSSA